MTHRPSRRCLLLAPLAVAGRPAAAAPPRLAVIDWGLAETVLALGVAPVAAAELRGYATWVQAPPMPPGVRDLGLRGEPNLEALSHAGPDLILATPQFAPFLPRLERVAPVVSFATYVPGGDPVARSAEVATELGRRLGHADAAARLIDDATAVFAAERARRAGRPGRPLLVASFVDARHLRVYGRNSLFGSVLERIGLPNGWSAATNAWGFATVPLERLAEAPDAALVLLEPLPPALVRGPGRNPLWAALPAVRAGRVAWLPPCWAFGGLPSATRFARALPHV